MTHPPDTTAPTASPMRWPILVMLMGLCFISHFNRTCMASAGDERIMKQFSISTEKMGMVYSGFLIVYTILMIPGGLFIDRFGPRVALALMGLSTAAFCVSTGAVGWGFIAAAQVWLSLMIVRSLMGLFTTPLHPACARAAANWFPGRQCALANGLITGAALLANALVHPVFGALIDRFDWPQAFLITGICTALLAVSWFIFARDFPWQKRDGGRPEIPPAIADTSQTDAAAQALAQAPEVSVITFGRLLRDRSLLLLTLSYGAVGYIQYMFFYWLHYYLKNVLHVGDSESRTYTMLPNLAMAVCMPLGGWLTSKSHTWFATQRGRTLVPKLGMIFSAALLMLGVLSKENFWIVLWFTLSLGVLGLSESAFWTMAVELGGRRGGTAAAIMNTGGNGIGLLAPMVTPAVSAALGWMWGIGLGALIGLLGALCWWGITPRDQGSTPEH